MWENQQASKFTFSPILVYLTWVSWWALSARKDGSLLVVSSGACIVLSDKKRLRMEVWAPLCATEEPPLKAINVHQRKNAQNLHSGWEPHFQLSSWSDFIWLCSLQLGFSDVRGRLVSIAELTVIHPSYSQATNLRGLQAHCRSGGMSVYLSQAPIWRRALSVVRRSLGDFCWRVTSETKL